MKTRVITLSMFLAIIASCPLAVAANTPNAEPLPTPLKTKMSPAGSPEAIIADLYRDHKSKTRDPFFESKSRVSLDRYFTKSLADLIWNDSVTSAKNNEVGVIDGDPLYDAQDMEIKNFMIGTAAINGDTAVVPVTFTNFGDKKLIKFNMKRVGDTWKVDDIDYGGEEGTLRKEFADSAVPAKPGTI